MLSSRHAQATEQAMSRFAFQPRIEFFSSVQSWQWLIKNKNQPFSEWKIQTTETSPDPDNLSGIFAVVNHARCLVFLVLFICWMEFFWFTLPITQRHICSCILLVHFMCLCVCLFSCSRWSLAQFSRQSTEIDWMNERTKKTTSVRVCLCIHHGNRHRSAFEITGSASNIVQTLANKCNIIKLRAAARWCRRLHFAASKYHAQFYVRFDVSMRLVLNVQSKQHNKTWANYYTDGCRLLVF